MISIFSFSPRAMSAFRWGRGGIRQKLLLLTILVVLMSAQYGAVQAQSGWYHCDIQDINYDGPGTRYFCRPVSYDWLCNTARITFFCSNRSARGDASDDNGDSDDSRRSNGNSSGGGSGSVRQASGSGSSINIRRIDAAGIGVRWIIDAGFIAAVDIWGEDVPEEVCLDGFGRLLFLDASTSPRAESWLDSVQRDGRTCAEIDGPGTVVLMAAGPTPASGTARQSQQCRVITAGHLKVRAGPSLDDDVIGYVKRGTTLLVLLRNRYWIEIEYEGKAGWIGAAFVRVSHDCSEDAAAPASETDRLSEQCRLSTTGHLKLRAAPDMDSEVIAYVPRGTRLRLISWIRYWFQVEYDGKEGWIGAAYVRVSHDCAERSPTPAGETVMPAARQSQQCGISTTGHLKLRTAPAIDGEVIAYVPRGTRLRLISWTRHWFNVEYEGKEGWIGGDYVNVSNECG
ncbi:MAG: SH3 domain-containing protein [Chloroflexi bacterium]|nr:SH3 domain-containing protein [Chloroflexota bacterium]